VMGNTVSRVVQQSDWFSSPWFPSALLYQTGWFILMWILSAPAKNAGLVDFAWPFGFSCLSLLHLLTGKGNLVRRILINSIYLLCGLRFNFGK
jgi:steroid 5-alpha reductase family enzyme